MATPSPYYGLYEAVVVNVIQAFTPCFAHLLDENNQPFSVPVRAEYASVRAEFSEVVVAVRPGTIILPLGQGVQYQEQDGSGLQFGVKSDDSLIQLIVKARSPAERMLIVDALISALLAGFVVAGGLVYEAAVQSQLMTAGVIVGGIDPIDYTPANEDEERPEGQVYQAEVNLRSTIWLTWKTPPFIANSYQINTALWGGSVGSSHTV